MNKNWIDEAIIRESVPKPAREETTREFCRKNGVEEKTYYYTMRQEINQKKILRIALNNAKKDAPEILNKLGENAKQGKEKSIELYLKFVAELATKLDIEVDEIKINQKEYESILTRVARKNSNIKKSIQE